MRYRIMYPKGRWLFAACLMIVFCSSAVLGQESKSLRLGLYSWKEGVVMTPSKIDGEATGEAEVISIPGQRFRVIKLDGTNRVAVIEVLDYTPNTPNFFQYNFRGAATDYQKLPKEKRDVGAFDASQIYFTVELDILADYGRAENVVPGGLAFGLINFPFKYRPQFGKGDFSGAFNFGAAVGYRFPYRESRDVSFSILTGYSISNVVIDSVSARRNQSLLASTNNYTALSFSLGGMIQNSKVQIGAFIGIDNLSRINQQKFGWEFQGKPWFSIGFGYAIFSSDKPQGDTSSKQSQSNP